MREAHGETAFIRQFSIWIPLSFSWSWNFRLPRVRQTFWQRRIVDSPRSYASKNQRSGMPEVLQDSQNEISEIAQVHSSNER
jgi:hypothetical protein